MSKLFTISGQASPGSAGYKVVDGLLALGELLSSRFADSEAVRDRPGG
jgi:hypothetical protein